MSDTITIVAKGPSADNAQKFIDAAPGTHVCAINDSGLLFTNHINWSFLSDPDVARKILHLRDRTDVFVFPSGRGEAEGMDISEWLGDGVQQVHYPTGQCSGHSPDMHQRLIEGGITHHNTVHGAMHWLCKHGKYRKMRLIGVDGGKGYAKGVFPGSPQAFDRIEKTHNTKDFLDVWKNVTKRLIHLLKCVYAVEVEWYGN
jgi:hypothetical protein